MADTPITASRFSSTDLHPRRRVAMLDVSSRESDVLLHLAKHHPLSEIRVKGVHFLQEDSSAEIGTALQEFVESGGGSWHRGRHAPPLFLRGLTNAG